MDHRHGHWGVFKGNYKKHKIPPLFFYDKKYGGLSASLWDILQLPQKKHQPEPQSAKDLKNVLEKYNLLTETNVFYCITLVPQHEMPWITGHTDTPIAPLCFFAYTKSDLSIGYAFRQPKKLNHHSLPTWIEDVDSDVEPDPFTLNRRTSVNVKLSGLLLAYSLGMCLVQEYKQLSSQISQCVGAIWATCDEEKHIRHIVYKDSRGSKTVELACKDDANNEKAWTSFFNFVQKAAAHMREEKEQILLPLLTKLHSFSVVYGKSLWSHCLGQLKTAIAKHKVFVFCNDDTILHQLKVPIAVVFKTPQSKGIYIQTLANYTITALSTTKVVFINLAQYFNYFGKIFDPYIDDDNLWHVAQDWLSHDGEDSFTTWAHPELKHNIGKLKHHQKIFGESTLSYVTTRSLRNAEVILKLWTALVH